MSDIWQRAKLRLAYLAIGLVVGLLAAGIPGAVIHKTTVREYEKRFELYATMTAQSVLTASELRAENEKLRTRKVERVNADGSKETITETSKDLIASSEKNSSLVDQIEVSERNKMEISSKEWNKLQKRGSYSLGVGLDQSGNKHIMFSYPVWNKLRGYGWVTEELGYGLGLGVEF